MATTKVTSLMIANLTDTSLYLDHFVCEAYSDSGLTLLVAQDSAKAKNVAGVWTQQGAMTLKGLTLGGTYYLRAGAVAPLSGIITWSSTFSLVVGTTTAPAPTFTFTALKTGSGTEYVVTPASVPSDINHYEAWWTLDGTIPTLAQTPNWRGLLNFTGKFTFFVGAHGLSIPTVYVRAVNTSMIQQAWFSLGTTSGGTLDHVVDGTNYIRNTLLSGAAIVLDNANFEQDSTLPPPGWVAGPGATLSYETSAPSTGVRSLIVTASTAGQYATTLRQWTARFNDIFLAKVNVNNVGVANAATLHMVFLDSSGATVNSVSVAAPFADSTWRTVQIQGTAGVGTTHVVILLECQTIGTAKFDEAHLGRVQNLEFEVGDSPTFARLGYVNPTTHQLHVSSFLNPQGSLAQAGLNTFSYTSTTTSISWSWGAFSIYAPDGSTISVSAGSFASFTGLTSTSTYHFIIYYNIVGGGIVVVKSDVLSGRATGSMQQNVQILNGDGNIPLSQDITADTTTSGGGGGGGVCFSPNTKVKTRNGFKTIDDMHGEYVLTARGTWRKVLLVTLRHYSGVVQSMGDDELVTPTHQLLRGGSWVSAEKVFKSVALYDGLVSNLEIEAEEDDDGSAGDTEHSYTLCNGEVAHNTGYRATC